jgi:L-asparaginase
VSVAANEQARGLGTVVVLNGAIHCAREVTKASTYQLQAFESREAGPLGYVDPDRRVRLLRCPTRRYGQDAGLDPRGSAELPRVDVAVSYVGGDGTAIDAFAAAGAKGLVFAGSGSGRGSPAEEDALARVSRRGVMVCVSSRVGAGRVVRSPRLIDLGFVAGDDLVPWKARVLLSLALTSNRRPDVVQELFDTC